MPLISPFGKATCPHCFLQFHLTEAPSRQSPGGARAELCSRLQNHFAPSPVVMLPPIENDPATRGNRPVWKKILNRFYVPRPPLTHRLICPTCGIYLPDGVANGEVSSEVIAIVGARSSGKSNYFGVLMHELKSRIGLELGFEVVSAYTFHPTKGPMNSSDLYKVRYGNLYNPLSYSLVSQTASAATSRGSDLDPRVPLIYQFRFKKHSWRYLTHPLSSRVPVYLSLFDAAGEDLADPRSNEQFHAFLGRATAILFLIDPFEFPGVRDKLPPELSRALKPVGADPCQVIDNVAGEIRRRRHIRDANKLGIPAAFVLTKSDLLEKISDIDTNSPIRRESKHSGGYDVVGGHDLSNEIQQHFRNWGASELLSKAQDNFNDSRFFCVSAIGKNPKSDMRLGGPPEPKRVGDPLLWLLNQRGYIPEHQRV